MNDDFSHFDAVKEAIDNNNKTLNVECSYLYLLYIGFCNHLYYYMNAYRLLFQNQNYYVCRSIERSVIDLYLKARVLAVCKDPEKVAESIIEEGKIRKDAISNEEKGYVTDTGLCKFFDELDETYQVIDRKTKRKTGQLERRYRESSDYIHPNIPCVWSYTTDNLGDWTGLIEDDKIQFNELVNNLMVVLEIICKILHGTQQKKRKR